MSSPFVIWTLAILLLLTSLFMILLVLIQRGRGGGLAGAFGGMGGQSAFGTRAGDVFTKITVVVAVIFILLASLLGKAMRAHQEELDTGIAGEFGGGSNVQSADAEDEAPPVMEAVNEDDASDEGDTSDTPSEDETTGQSDEAEQPAEAEPGAEPDESSSDGESSETPGDESVEE